MYSFEFVQEINFSLWA